MPLAAVGKGVPRIDGAEKAAGRAIYGVDVKLPGMLVGKILRSPHPHARIRSVDVSRALELRGVRAVITAEDTPGIRYGFVKSHNPKFADCLPLQGDKVRFVGDEVAAVAAVDADAAEEALALVRVDYEPLEAVFEIEDALREGAPVLHDFAPGNVLEEFTLGAGDLEEGLAGADVTIRESFRTQAVTPCCLETHQCAARVEADGRFTIWSSTQMPFMLRRHLAEVLDVPESRVRVIKTTMGAGFGSRMEMHAVDPVCALLAKRTGKPVAIIYTREEEFVASRYRHPLVMEVRLGARADGVLSALHMTLTTDSGAYCSQAPGITRVGGQNAMGLYRAPHARCDAKIVYTNKPPGGGFRGYGSPQSIFALESSMDILAEALSLDPLELRLKNAHTPNTTTVFGQKISTCGFVDCLRLAAEEVDWKQRREAPRPWRGVGMAGLFFVGGGARDLGDCDATGAVVKMEDDGSATILTGSQEIGQGAMTILAQMAAEELGIPVGRIRVVNDDTDVIPWDVGCHAQRNTFIAGNAVRLAARDAREQILRAAGEMLEVEGRDLVIEDGRVFVPSAPDNALSIAEVIERTHYREGGDLILGRGVYDPPTQEPDARGHGHKTATYAFGVQAVEVEVEPETGRVRVLKVAAAHDVGKAVNPPALEGQIEGGIAQALGFSLSEEMVWESGQLSNGTLADYKLPTPLDMPPITTHIVETEDPEGPFGAKGVGECTIVPLAAAISNAVYHATGVRITDLPITGEKVFLGLQARASRDPGRGIGRASGRGF